MSHSDDKEIARQGRLAALVIAGSAVLSIFAPQIATIFGGTPRVEMLFYLFSLAGFIWSLVVTFRLWQKTRDR